MKIAHLCISKGGSNILRNELGWQGREGVAIRKEEKQKGSVGRMLNEQGGHVFGHLHYTKKFAGWLKDHFIIFQYRDPRDVIVSTYHWLNKIHEDKTWEDAVLRASNNMVEMEPWYEHCNLALRYEHLIEKEYPPTHTFRKGIVGSWKEEFPDDLWDLYYELCEPVLYWEYNACIHCG